MMRAAQLVNALRERATGALLSQFRRKGTTAVGPALASRLSVDFNNCRRPLAWERLVS